MLTRMLSLALALCLCGIAAAQDGPTYSSQREAFPGFYSSQDSPPPVTTYEMARQPYTRYEGQYDACQSHRPDYRRMQMMQARRDTEAARRQKSRAALPPPIYDTEKLAVAKFNAAHQLWLAGNSDAAKRWLETVVREYSSTQVADRARVTLARL